MEESRDTYRTISGSGEATFKDKGSRFIGYIYNITEEDQVKEIVASLKKQHYSARHHCYAWRIGSDGVRHRSNDDGEPSGSAGKPILGQLLSSDLTNVLVVVVRYFGGTLLGVPGLINAYREATKLAIEEVDVVEEIVEHSVMIQFDYIVMNDVMKISKEYSLEQISSEFDNLCTITFAIRDSTIREIVGRLEKITSLILLNRDDLEGII